MDRDTRNRIQSATQAARSLLEREYGEQLEGIFDIRFDGTIASEPGGHLSAAERILWQKLVAAVEHCKASGMSNTDTVAAYLREAAFTTLNRFVALKMLEARGLVQECISRGDQSSGFKEFTGLAPGLVQLPDYGYRLYLESLFDEIGREVRVLFDRREPASLLWPRRQALLDLLAVLNDAELAEVWKEDETIGWVYQYFNSDAERRQMRAESQAPRDNRELSVRNQFFTPRYIVEFLTDNTLGCIWYEMRQGETALKQQCKYLVRRPREVFLLSPDRFQPKPRPEIAAAFEGDFSHLPDPAAVTCDDLEHLALAVDGYTTSRTLGLADCGELANRALAEFRKSGRWMGDAAELWCCLFFEQTRWRHFGCTHEGTAWEEIKALYGALRAELQKDTSDLSQGELLKQPVYIPFRAKKDPRDLKIIDPACGSGHFLLYAFNLLLTVYEEAWEDVDAPRSQLTGKTLRKDFGSLTELRAAMPGLILRCNLHGIDIDPRCAQIASLALWMRTQRAYSDFGIARGDRPPIAKTNIVVAEPMPGEKELRAEFMASLNDQLGRLVERVFAKMELAGEAGSLLKIENEIQSAIRDIYGETGELFRKSDEERWREAEEELVGELGSYAEAAQTRWAYRRRLFAEDAARGFAFIDICRQLHDIVVMNPPFGELPKKAKGELEKTYAPTKSDIYACFVARALSMLDRSGRLGAITSRTGFFLTSFSYLREQLLMQQSSLRLLADLGSGVLDGAMVETAAFVTEAT